MQNSNKKMLLFYSKLSILFALIIVIGLIFNLYTDRLYDMRHFGAETDKIQHLKEIEENKTIFVGGSSVLSGVSAQHYSEISGEEAINMGLHALEPYDVYLATIAPYVQKGDKVILALEYTAYCNKWNEYDDVGLIVAHESKEYFKNAGTKHKPQYYYQQILRSYSKVYETLYHNIIEVRLKGEEKAYLRKNINEYGDIKPEINADTENPQPQKYSLEITKEAANEISCYIQKYEQKGAKVYVVFPPIYTDIDIKSNKKNIDAFYKQMQDFFGKNRVLGYPTDWMFNTGEKFWDTGYHLNAEACREHTEYYYNLIRSAE